MASAFWKGTLGFGLVEIPVSLKPAVDEKELSFTLLDRQDFSPVGNKRYNKKTGREVPWDRVIRGYEYEPDEYVVLSDQELRNANVRATQSIDLFAFVKEGDIPSVYFETPYFIEPLKKGSKSYSLLRAALERTHRVGLARVVLRTRQRLAALIVRDSVMMLDLLRYPHDLRKPESATVAGAKSRDAAVSPREMALAERLIHDMAGKWSPSQYRDEYRDDVLKLVKRKVRAGQTRTIVEPETEERGPRADSDVIDLMPLLKKSLGAGRARSGATPAKHAESANSAKGAEGAKRAKRAKGSRRALTAHSGKSAPARPRTREVRRRRSA